MSKIHVLDNLTANSIAAGEVVERPSSVVKELVENSLDAGASVISVEIKQGGIKSIRVSDNGSGLEAEDARLAFQRHATSKILKIDDLQELVTMGFRGEALASIAAVSQVTLTTKQPGSEDGLELRLESGEIIHESISGCPDGTSILIENLFFNTPARYKFLKRDQTEASYVTDLIERMALARPDISFRLFNQGQEILHTPGNNDLMSSIFSVYGKETATACLPVEFNESPVQVSGYVTSPQVSRHNRNRQNIFVNGRLIQSKMITAAIDEACHTWFMKSRYPALVLNITLPMPLVDVNVHPQKMEVRFWDERKVFHCIYHGIKQALINHSGIAPDSIDQAINDSGDSINAITDSISSSENAKTLNPDSAVPVQIELGHSLPSQLEADPVTGEIIESTSAVVYHTPQQSDINKPKHEQINYEKSDKQSLQFNDKSSSISPDSDEGNKNSKRINSLLDARIIGQAFQTYLILECNGELFLVDQHAAHERIIYERLVNRNASRTDSNNRQPLLVPEAIHVSRSEKQEIIMAKDEFAELGFEFDDFGHDTLLLRTVPAHTEELIKPGAAFRVLIDSYLDQGIKGPEAINQIYENIACKAAVKAHDLLHESEMNRLLEDLQALENPYHCPHGRPIIVRMSKYELEKKFKRIV